MGADARLRRHRRDVGVLRPALPLDLLGAAEDESVGHRRRRDRDRRARDAQRRRRAGGGEALDRARGDRLRDAGAARPARRSSSSSARRSSSTTSTGAWRRPGRTSRSRSPSRCSPTRGSRPSPTSPRRPASRPAAFPNAYKLVAAAVFAIYLTLPLVALSAMPVKVINGQLTTLLALPPEQGGYANDPILGLVQNLGVEGGAAPRARDLRRRARGHDPLHRDERGRHRRLADHVLDGELPPDPRGLPAAAPDVQDAGALARPLRRDRADPDHPPGRRELRRHALLVRRHALVHGRPRLARAPADEAEGRDRGVSTARDRTSVVRGVDWPLFAIVGGLATGASFLVIVVQNPTTRWVGLGWIASGWSFYVIYRRRFVRALAHARRVKAPPAFGPALALEYRRLLVPSSPGQPSDDALDVACSLAAERGAQIVALNVLEVPLDLPLDADLPRSSRTPPTASSTRRSRSATRTASRRSTASSAPAAPAPAIVEEAERRGTEIIVIGTPRKALTGSQQGRVRDDGRLRAPPCALPRHGRAPRDGEVRGVIWYRRAIFVFSGVFVVIGVALLVVTAVNGGGLDRLPARRRSSSPSGSAGSSWSERRGA